MQSDHSLLYRWLMLITVGISLAVGYQASRNRYKNAIAYPIPMSVLYIGVTIWNWVVFQKNGNSIHSHMFSVSADVIPGFINEFFTIPICTIVTG